MKNKNLEVERLVKKIEWYDSFCTFVLDNNPNLFNESCEFADDITNYKPII